MNTEDEYNVMMLSY